MSVADALAQSAVDPGVPALGRLESDTVTVADASAHGLVPAAV
jgi:hypothetical protein